MPRYAITEKAGRIVAGQTNTGVGSVLTLTEEQAAADLRLGALHALDARKPDAKPVDDSKAPGARKKAKTV